MSKKLRKEPLFIASDIIGWLDDNYVPQVLDKRTNQKLDPRNIDDKIIIYERQVNDWFLNPAKNLLKYKNENKQFISLMICFSYLEGVQQYREGGASHGGSKACFCRAMERIYPNQYSQSDLESFYIAARCGLFHNGMVRQAVVIDNSFRQSIEFDGNDIKISPSKLLKDINNDFHAYIEELRLDQDLRHRFDSMFSNI